MHSEGSIKAITRQDIERKLDQMIDYPLENRKLAVLDYQHIYFQRQSSHVKCDGEIGGQ